MKQVSIKDEDGKVNLYEIPSSWDDINVGQFQLILKLQNNFKDVNSIGITETVNIVSSITSIDKSLLYDMTPDQFKLISEEIEFIQQAIDDKPSDFIEVDGEKYWLKKDFDKLKLGEVASIETITKKYDGEISVALPELLTVFLRKKDENGKLEKYNVEDFEERTELFKKVKINKVYNVMSFFLNGKDISELGMKDSSVNKE